MTTPLSADQQARLAAIEAAPEAEESVRRRLVAAIEPWFRYFAPGDNPQPTHRQRLEGAAEVAIAVLRGPSVADEAVRRCEAVAEQYEQHVAACREEGITVDDTLVAAAIDIRAALNGGDR